MLPDPVVERHGGIWVVRDDLLPAGTKQRLPWDRMLAGASTHALAAPVYGFAQIALAWGCQQQGKRAVIFSAARKEPHPLSLRAAGLGAEIVPVPFGRMSVLRRRALDRVGGMNGQGRLWPLGFDLPEVVEALAAVVAGVLRRMPESPSEVWCCAGSGTMCRAIQQAWNGPIFAVLIGKNLTPAMTGRALQRRAPEDFGEPAVAPPPFPSNPWYDAKAWRFVRAEAKPGALFWNVAA
jgi:hypothetical protein